MSVAVLGVDNVLIAVGDLGEAVRFYAGHLGLPVRMRVEEAGIVLSGLGSEAPGLLARLTPGLAPRPATASPRLWLEVSDAREAAGVLASSGVAPLAPPFRVHTGWTVEVADPWGNVVGLTDYVFHPELACRREAAGPA
ncbi:VOC family protein [Thermoactinospora rubra]|uniref:VOC family protein n=1 Tax=Thermoactinospora rubra TaxID=1088767 RepID=UPI000A0F5068|nr:VOC family protein [Thermoactinospora rubra]